MINNSSLKLLFHRFSEGVLRFYLYPLESFPSFWGPQSTCDHSIVLSEKHDGYIFAIQAMKRHPWRTSNPEEAMLAFLPISVDMFVRGGCPGLKERTVLDELEAVIRNSSIFPRVRHVFMANDFESNYLRKKISSSLHPAGIVAGVEGRGDCRTSVPYREVCLSGQQQVKSTK